MSVPSFNDRILQRVREYCELAAAVDHQTNELIDDPDNDPRPGPRNTKPWANWNIKTMAEWEATMQREMRFLVENKAMVMRVLPKLKKDWPSSVAMLTQFLKQF